MATRARRRRDSASGHTIPTASTTSQTVCRSHPAGSTDTTAKSSRFDIEKYGGLVDQIIHSEGVYIQPGRPGDRLSTTFDNPRVLAEVTSRAFLAAGVCMLWKEMC